VVIVRWARVDTIDPDAAPEHWSAGELERLAALRRPVDRRHFVGARRLLRRAVVAETGCEDDDIVVHQRCHRCGGPHGRPQIEIDGTAGPEVGFAHAGGLVIVAVSDRPVGVDVEPTDGADELVTWVRTEALLKATGHGLDVHPSLLRLSAPEDRPRLLEWRGPGRKPVVVMADVDTAPGFVAAVVRTGRGSLSLDAAEADP